MGLPNNKVVKGADFARKAVAFRMDNPNKAARRAMAGAAIRLGNYDANGRAVWQEYLDAGCPQRAA